MKKQIKILQWGLTQLGIDCGLIDGIWGIKTETALNQVSEVPLQWPRKRRITAFIQFFATQNNIDAGPIDGLWGPQTQFAYDQLVYLFENGQYAPLWRDQVPLNVNPNHWPNQNPESEIIQFYGSPGENQTRIELPYPHKLAWDKSKTVNSYLCHEKVHDSLKRVLTKVLEHYGMDEIKRLRLDLWGGCLNVRKMRGGSRYSMHSWGIAVDYDPSNNQLNWGRDRATFAKPAYDMWWKIWEEEGWLSLGREKNFDWMHIQAAKI